MASPATMLRGSKTDEKGFTLSGVQATVQSGCDTQYHSLSEGDAVAYAERTLPLWTIPEGGNSIGSIKQGVLKSAVEVGDGNLNLVFCLLDHTGRSRVVLKQALPYVRSVGESWQLTLDRCRLEAETLLAHHAICPEVTEQVLYYEPTMAVMVVEDLSDCAIWRHELVRVRMYDHIVPLLARYLAHVHFFTSDFAANPTEKKLAMQRFTNVEMCRITEDLIFTDPYMAHERNQYERELEPFVQQYLHNDAELLLKVAQLKYAFMNQPQAHIHGDLHCGSVFIDATRVKVIDAEFGFYGPMGFDIGTVIGNLLINYLAIPSLLAQRTHQCDDVGKLVGVEDTLRVAVDLTTGVANSRQLLLRDITALWERFSAHFVQLAKTCTCDSAFAAASGFAGAFLEGVWRDTVGFAGAEMVRRSVGLAHVADVEVIANIAQRVSVRKACILLGTYLIKNASSVSSVAELVKSVEQTTS